MSANPGNVIGGHKAALHNPNVSEEAKENSREVLKEMEGTESATDNANTGKDPSHVIGGLKAAISNPNVSEEAKQHDREVLKEMHASETGSAQKADVADDGKDINRQIAGLKGALKNPNNSDEAKEDIKAKLTALGAAP